MQGRCGRLVLTLPEAKKKAENLKSPKAGGERFSARNFAEKLQRQSELERLKGPSEDMKVESYPQAYSKNKHRDGFLLPYKPVFVYNSNVPWDDPSGDDDCTDVGHDDNDAGVGRDTLEMETEPDFKLDGGDLLNDAAELDEEIEKVLRRQTSLLNGTNSQTKSPKVEKSDTRDPTHVRTISCWASEMQLVKFRETAEQVADQYLKAANLKLDKNRDKQTTVKDHEAYRQGREDSKKMDVRRKLIEWMKNEMG